jgi:DNA polymerase III epsilon subunit-like protein
MVNDLLIEETLFYSSLFKLLAKTTDPMLQLNKPLAFIDLETTGVNLGIDRIVEIAIVKILTDGTKIVKRKLTW